MEYLAYRHLRPNNYEIEHSISYLLDKMKHYFDNYRKTSLEIICGIAILVLNTFLRG